MRLLFLGDIVGRAGRDAVIATLPGLREKLRLDLVVVNAENASHGFGLAPEMAFERFARGPGPNACARDRCAHGADVMAPP